ncbi:hypothetical protein KVR01_000933 [Diaporthe batatas]|uniref:uncharacterized protein n=1 Tax=Diaporthe batatas TaxID=748121 RepID=UPI001D0370DA|nr:uncharacterized protein KVR01_000933 [Diaporthe batatas]KAG8170188.1 hypothetical protein KVR01_000933 [Diaporthe batatas]
MQEKWYAGLAGCFRVDGDPGKRATFYVAAFTEKACEFKVDVSSIGWVFKSKSKAHSPLRIVITPNPENDGWRQIHDTANVPCPPNLEFSNSWDDRVFKTYKWGRALKLLPAIIHPCEDESRPELLYRAVHDEHPGSGLESRGSLHGKKTDPLNFMLQFDHHLNWKCRDASPFMSTTTKLCKAATIASRYQRKGFKNIEILVIQGGERYWPSKSRMWHVKETAEALGLVDVLSHPWFDDHEYLIEDYIPEAYVTRLRWEDMKADIDAETRLIDHFKKRKLGVSKSSGSEDETLVGDGLTVTRPQILWGLIEKRSHFSSRNKPKYYYEDREDDEWFNVLCPQTDSGNPSA